MSDRPVTEADCQRILEENQRFSENGLRVLAFGYKETTVEERLCTDNEKDFIFLGLVAMMDPPREESAQAVAEGRHSSGDDHRRSQGDGQSHCAIHRHLSGGGYGTYRHGAGCTE